MSAPVAALIVRPDGTAEILDIVPDLDTLKSIVGGWIEDIAPRTSDFGRWHAYVDEEGKLKDAPLNVAASDFARSVGWLSGETLRGSVVFLGHAPEGEEGDVPPEVVGAAVRLWGLPE